MKALVSYRGIPQSPRWATGDFVVEAFTQLGFDVDAYGNYYGTQNKLQVSLDPFEKEYDLFLYMECGDGEPAYTELKNVKAKNRMSWFFDLALYPEYWQWQISTLNTNTNFVANELFVADEYKRHYLPYAAASKHFRKLNWVTKDIDYLIIGSDRPERRKQVADLMAMMPDKNIQLVSGIFREDYVNTLSRAKFVVNDIAGGGKGLLPMRPFEVVAAGATLITPKNDGVSSLGIPCHEYESIEQIPTFVEELSHGQDVVRQKHTYLNRCMKIMGCMK